MEQQIKKGAIKGLTIVCALMAAAVSFAQPSIGVQSQTDEDPSVLAKASITLEIGSGTPPYTFYGFGDTIVYPGDTIVEFEGLAAGIYNVSVIDDNDDNTYITVFLLSGIMWTNEANVTTDLYTIDRTTGSNSWDAGASSVNFLPPLTDGYVIFVPALSAGSPMMVIGLSKKDYNLDNSSIRYGFHHDGSNIRPMHNGNLVGSSVTYTTGDFFAIARNGSDIEFYKNSSVIHSIAVSDEEQLYIDVHIYRDGNSAQVPNIKASFGVPFVSLPAITHQTPNLSNTGSIDPKVVGGVPPYTYLWSTSATTPTVGGLNTGTYSVTVTDNNSSTMSATYEVNHNILWQNLVNASATTTSATSTTGAFGYNAGTSSKNILLPGQDGYFEFEVEGLGVSYVIGLTRHDYNTHNSSIKYAFGLNHLGGVSVELWGNAVGTYGGYGPGDKFRIARESDNIKFYKNGMLLYSYSPPFSETLIADIAFYYGDNKASNTNASFGVPFKGFPAIVHNTPNNSASGSISLSPDGGTGPYTYAWNDMNTSASRTGLPPGTYTVTVTDAGNNTVSETVTLGHQISWANQVHVTSSGNSITKTGGTTDFDGGASSVNKLLAGQDGFIELELSTINYSTKKIGFAKHDPSPEPSSINYGLYLYWGSVYALLNNNSVSSAYEFGLGDVLRLERVGSTMYYKLNGSVFHSLAVDPNENLILDLGLLYVGEGIANIRVSFPTHVGGFGTVTEDDPANPGSGAIAMGTTGGTAPYSYAWNDGSTDGSRTGLNAGIYEVTVTDANSESVGETYFVHNKITWQNANNVATTVNGMRKTSSSGSWNGGASSIEKLGANENGYVATTYIHPGIWYAFGLSESDPDADYASIDYCIQLGSWSTITIYENGVSAGSFGTAIVGDVFRVVRMGSEIKYYKNGDVIRTVSTTPSAELIADVSIYNTSTMQLPISISFGTQLDLTETIIAPTTASPDGGSIALEVHGGFAPYSFAWSNTSDQKNLGGLSIGIYGITVTDILGNTVEESFTLINDQQIFWTGADDGDWHNPLNWSWLPCGPSADTIPDSTMTVVFTGCADIQALLSDDAKVNRIKYTEGYSYFTDENGHTLTISEGMVFDNLELSLGGNLTISHDLEILSGAVTLNGYGLTLNGKLTLTGGVITVGSGRLEAGGDVILTGGTLDCGTGELEIQQELRMVGGSVDGGSAAMSITGNLDIAFGGFASTSGILALGADLKDPYGFFQHGDGKVSMANSGTINTRAPLYDLTISTGSNTVLTQPLTVLHTLELDGSVSLGGHDLTLGWSSASAIQNDGGKILAEGNAFAGKVIWNIGTSTGTYSIPFTNNYGEDLTVEVDINIAGTGSGILVAALYPTNSNMEPLPAGMPSLYGPDDTPDYEQIMQRFWQVDFVGYTDKPTANLTVKYVDRDLNGITVPTDLKAQEWKGYGWGEQVGLTSVIDRTVSLTPFKGGIFVLNTLDDILYPYRHDDFATLKRKLDGSYYIAIDGLNVKYDEGYNTGNLNYAVYNQQRELVFGSSLGHNIAKAYGDNRFFIRCHCHTGIFTDGQFYVLEVTNEKGEKFMLRFQYKYTRPCIQIGLQNQGVILD